MKLQDLFNEVKLGKEEFEFSKSTDDIVENYDADYNKFMSSHRVATLSEGISTDTSTNDILKKVVSLLEEVENREIKNTVISPAFYKLRLITLTESYNKLIGKFENKKYTKEIDRTKFGKMLGTLQYCLEEISESAGFDYAIGNTPVLLEELATTEKELIVNIVK